MTATHILIIDNYDSFVHNLARYVQIAGANITIKRNDELSLEDIKTLKPDGIVISPGPKAPQDAGISIDIIKKFGPNTPILGVCLGHQAIGEAFGGRTDQTAEHAHGRSGSIKHDGSVLYQDIPSPFEAGRYHSLINNLEGADGLTVTARLEDTDLIMGVQHSQHPIYGVQFHPESILTPHGQTLINNFIQIVKEHK